MLICLSFLNMGFRSNRETKVINRETKLINREIKGIMCGTKSYLSAVKKKYRNNQIYKLWDENEYERFWSGYADLDYDDFHGYYFLLNDKTGELYALTKEMKIVAIEKEFLTNNFRVIKNKQLIKMSISYFETPSKINLISKWDNVLDLSNMTNDFEFEGKLYNDQCIYYSLPKGVMRDKSHTR